MSPEPKQKTGTQQVAGEEESVIHASPSNTPGRQEQNTGQQSTLLGSVGSKRKRKTRVSRAGSSPPRTPTPKSRPASVSHHSAPTVTEVREAPIEFPSAADESPSVAVANRRRTSASSKPTTPSRRSQKTPHLSRPAPEKRSATDPLPSHTPIPFRTTDFEIENVLRHSAKASEGHAFVYVLSATHANKRIVKIGQTAGPIKRRVRQLERECPCILFDPVSIDFLHPRVEQFYATVEKLAHTELQDRRYTFKCCCGKDHREYFDVEPEIACHVVQRWARFCKARPWRPPRGDMLPIKDSWGDRLNCWRKGHDDPPEDLAALLGRWDRFVDTSWLDWLWYDLRVGSGWLARYWGEALLLVLCVMARFQLGDRGWLARLAEYIMLMVLMWLAGFRSVFAEGLLESLFEVLSLVVTAVRQKTPDHHSWKLAVLGSSDDVEDNDVGKDDRSDMEDIGDEHGGANTDDEGVRGGGDDRKEAHGDVDGEADDAENPLQGENNEGKETRNKGSEKGGGENGDSDKNEGVVGVANEGEVADVDMSPSTI